MWPEMWLWSVLHLVCAIVCQMSSHAAMHVVASWWLQVLTLVMAVTLLLSGVVGWGVGPSVGDRLVIGSWSSDPMSAACVALAGELDWMVMA